MSIYLSPARSGLVGVYWIMLPTTNITHDDEGIFGTGRTSHPAHYASGGPAAGVQPLRQAGRRARGLLCTPCPA